MRLQVSGVRNLAEQEIAFDMGLNLVIGDNGQGKTSLLEAIYLLGTTRSFRTPRLADIVAIGGGPARVSGDGETPGESLAVLVSRNERRYLRHGKVVPPAGYLGTMDVVALSNDIVQGFRRQPAERRRFLDRMALATYPAYLDDLGQLRRACVQRAALVAASGRGADRAAWDERAADLAVPVVRRRYEMAQALERHLREASARIFPEGQGARVKLITRPAYEPGAEASYKEMLYSLFAAQEPAGGRRETPAGPMRDDLMIEMDGRDILKLGSAGQVRSLLTAAVLAEMTRLKALKERFPVLVLDDVDADLDEGRYAALLAALDGGAQVFAAGSKSTLAAGSIGAARRFTVNSGMVTQR